MKTNKTITKQAGLLVLLCFFFLGGCRDESPLDIEEGPNAQLERDTIPLVLRTGLGLTFGSNNLERDVIGFLRDPIYGGTQANLYSQLLMVEPVEFADNGVKLDSIVLTLHIDPLGDNRILGDPSTPQTWNVFEVSETFGNNNYFFDTSLERIQTPIGVATFTRSRNDTSIRIRLSDSFGQRLLSAPQSVYENNAAFLNYFKGFAIIPQPTIGNTGALYRIISEDPRTQVNLYYKDNIYRFALVSKDTKAIRFNGYRHELAGSEAQTQISNFSTIFPYALIKGLGALRVSITAPTLESYAKRKDIGLHKADIYFPIASPNSIDFTPPSILLLFNADQNGLNLPSSAPDFGTTYYDGGLSTATGMYHFGLTRTIQQVLSGYANDTSYQWYGLNLIPTPNQPVQSSGARLDNSTTGGAFMVLTYTKLNR